MRTRGTTIDYDALLVSYAKPTHDELVRQLAELLPPLWQKAYRKMAQSPTSIHQFSHRGFDFLFDRASELHSRGVVPDERAVEDRIIVAYGRSAPGTESHSNGSRRNLLGAAAARFGDNTDRPYQPGRILGKTFDISLYPQYRDLEKERSADGRAYRAMKKHCSEHPGTFCFTRLIYASRSWRPTAIEHGLLRTDGRFWVRKFKNATAESRLLLLPGSGRRRRKTSAEVSTAD
ncbi:hypothetical protein ACFLSW_00495 [Candidatus Bipolaricaulota bacterium]